MSKTYQDRKVSYDIFKNCYVQNLRDISCAQSMSSFRNKIRGETLFITIRWGKQTRKWMVSPGLHASTIFLRRMNHIRVE